MVEYEPGPNLFRPVNGEGALVVDATGMVRSANPAAAEAFGTDRRELVGRSLYALAAGAVDTTGEALVAASCPLRAALASGLAVRDIVIGLGRPSGRRWWSVTCRPTIDGHRVAGAVCTFAEVASACAAGAAPRPPSRESALRSLEALARLARLPLPASVLTLESPWAPR